MSARIVLGYTQYSSFQTTVRRFEVNCQAASNFTMQPGALRSPIVSSQKPMSTNPYCDWPRSCTWPRDETSSRPVRNGPIANLKSALGLSEWFTSEDTSLPPDVEQLALFSDSPDDVPEHSNWWSEMWRYQGPGL